MSKSGLPGTRVTRGPKKLLDQVRDAVWCKHYAYRTGETYIYWAKRFVLYRDKRHRPGNEISPVLATLAGEENGAASTRYQALSALFFRRLASL